MKMHKNQWLWTMLYPSERLTGAICRGHTMAPEVQTPLQACKELEPVSSCWPCAGGRLQTQGPKSCILVAGA